MKDKIKYPENLNNVIIFNNWQDISEKIYKESGIRPYSGDGIFWKKNLNVCILRATDNYENKFEINKIYYSLYRDKNTKKQNIYNYKNQHLLHCKYVILYRVIEYKKQKSWLYYGKYYVNKIKNFKDNICVLLEKNKVIYPENYNNVKLIIN